MHKNILRTLIVLGIAASAVATMTPQVSAQAANPSFSVPSIDAPTSSLIPDGLAQQVTVHWRYTWGGTSVGQNLGAVYPTATLTWVQPTCTGDNGGIFITGALSQTFSLGGSSSTSPPPPYVDGTSTFQVSAGLKAPGETPIQCAFSGKVGAIVSQGSEVPETGAAGNAMTVQVAYLGLITADVPTTIQESGPQKEIRYDIKLTNRGNALTNVKFELVGAPEAGWIAQQPVQAQLDSLQQGGSTNQGTVTFIVSTPHKNGWNNAETSFQLKMTPFSTKNKDLTGNDITVPVIARVRGIYVPGPDPVLMVGAVLGTALIARKLRNA